MTALKATWIVAWLACVGAGAEETVKPTDIEFFEKEIRPLLSEKCYSCHGVEKHKAGLRMNSRAAILKGGETGAAAVPGKAAESLMIKAIGYTTDTQMPPKAKLKDAEIAALTKWVNLGMPWPAEKTDVAVETKKEFHLTDEQRAFWSFLPVKAATPPPVKDAAWAKSDIDRFILAQLEANNLKPAQPADKRTLIRRATFDLTGLPPTPEEVQAFLDDTSPEAFAKVVERLLASPAYGERWGRHWLDVVRYADSRDSRGQGSDGDITDAWRYRDWIVNAFNADMPYDQFVIQQIAGDLIPAKEPGKINADGLVATGLLTIGEWGNGDADKEKMMTDIVDDQIDVVCRGIMGLTMACARCHDHKFDPLATADYYALAGIFFSTHIIPVPGKKTDGSAMLRTPLVPPEEIARINANKTRAAELEKLIGKNTDSAYAEFMKSLLPQTGKYVLAAREFQLAEKAGKKEALGAFAASRGLHEFALAQWLKLLGSEGPMPPLYPLMSKNVRDVAGNPGVYSWRGNPDCPSMIINTNDNAINITTLKLPPKSVSVHPGPNNGVAVGWKSPITGIVKISGKVTDADNVCGDGIAWALDHRAAAGVAEIVSGEIANGGTQNFDQAKDAAKLGRVSVQAGDMIYLLVLPKGEYTCDTTTLELSIAKDDGSAAWNLTQDLVAEPLQGNPHADRLGNNEVWHFADMAEIKRTRSPAALLSGALANLRAAADMAAAQSAANELQKRVDAASADAKDPLYLELTGPKSPYVVSARDDAKYLKPETAAELAKQRSELDTLKKTPVAPIPTALAAQEGGVPTSAHEGIKDVRIHVRGQYNKLGELVPRRFPWILAGDKQTPLGEITKTSGRMELAKWIVRPEHPLTARVMVNRIWQYHFGEGIVRSASNFGKLGDRPTHPELLDYLAKKFVDGGWSVKAMHRAIMLGASYQQASEGDPASQKADPDNKHFGRMNRRRLEAEALRDSLLSAAGTLDKTMGGMADKNPLTARRMLYLMTTRSDRSSFGPLFDAADAAAQISKRTISTVAPQALYMLNHNFVLDQTVALVKRLQGVKEDEARIAQAYALLYSRPPEAAEKTIGLEFLKRLRAEGSNDEQAWTAYCQVLLCANEFVFVD
jgi:hypothetical protein